MKTDLIIKQVTFKDIGCTVLIPIDIESNYFFKKHGTGEVVQCSLKVNRNYELLKKYWACCNMIAQNFQQPGFDIRTKDGIDYYCRIKCDLVDCYIVTPKETIVKAKSISYENMSEQKFQEYFNLAIKIMCEISNLSEFDILENWHEYK